MVQNIFDRRESDKSHNWTWLDFRDPEARQGREMDQSKEKRYPTTAGVHMVNQISFISSQFTEGPIWFHFLCFHFLFKQSQGRNDQTQRNLSANSRSYQCNQGEHPLIPINHNLAPLILTGFPTKMGIPAEWLCFFAKIQHWMHSSLPVEQRREYWPPVLPEQFSFCHLFSI